MPVNELTVPKLINHDSCRRFIGSCRYAIGQGATQLHLVMNGCAGDQGVALDLYEVLKRLPVRVFAHSTGLVRGLAIPLYLSAGWRTASPDCRFIVDPWEQDPPVVPPFGILRIPIPGVPPGSLGTDYERYVRLFQEATEGAQRPVDIHSALDRADSTELDAVEAKAAGMVHEISGSV